MTKQDYERQIAALREKRSFLRERAERLIVESEECETEVIEISEKIRALQQKRLDRILGV